MCFALLSVVFNRDFSNDEYVQRPLLPPLFCGCHAAKSKRPCQHDGPISVQRVRGLLALVFQKQRTEQEKMIDAAIYSRCVESVHGDVRFGWIHVKDIGTVFFERVVREALKSNKISARQEKWIDYQKRVGLFSELFQALLSTDFIEFGKHVSRVEQSLDWPLELSWPQNHITIGSHELAFSPEPVLFPLNKASGALEGLVKHYDLFAFNPNAAAPPVTAQESSSEPLFVSQLPSSEGRVHGYLHDMFEEDDVLTKHLSEGHQTFIDPRLSAATEQETENDDHVDGHFSLEEQLLAAATASGSSTTASSLDPIGTPVGTPVWFCGFHEATSNEAEFHAASATSGRPFQRASITPREPRSTSFLSAFDAVRASVPVLPVSSFTPLPSIALSTSSDSRAPPRRRHRHSSNFTLYGQEIVDGQHEASQAVLRLAPAQDGLQQDEEKDDVENHNEEQLLERFSLRSVSSPLPRNSYTYTTPTPASWSAVRRGILEARRNRRPLGELSSPSEYAPLQQRPPRRWVSNWEN